MTIAHPYATDAEPIEQRVVLSSISWETYLRIDEALSEAPRRTKFLGNQLEITAPISRDHERFKGNISRMIVCYCRRRGIFFHCLGAMTLRREGDRAGEADESYTFTRGQQTPDLVLEIALTSGGIDKLKFYAGFQVPEVWIWQRSALKIFTWSEGNYVPASRSRLLPDLDLFLLEQHADAPSTWDALEGFERALG